jgi:hypothetical protein
MLVAADVVLTLWTGRRVQRPGRNAQSLVSTLVRQKRDLLLARQVQTMLVDDLDGSEAAETVVFAVAGRDYEIDLSEAHAQQLREAVAPFVRAGRQLPGGRGRGRTTPAPAVSQARNREQSAVIREWAQAKGFEVSSRGRIPAAVLHAYEQRVSTSTSTAPAIDELAEQTAKPVGKPKRTRTVAVADPFILETANP